MGKLKEIIKWIATDGLLHIQSCYSINLACVPVVGYWWAKGITAAFAIGKEVVDVLRGKNNWEQVSHDLICDAAGMLMTDLTVLVWWLCNL